MEIENDFINESMHLIGTACKQMKLSGIPTNEIVLYLRDIISALQQFAVFIEGDEL